MNNNNLLDKTVSVKNLKAESVIFQSLRREEVDPHPYFLAYNSKRHLTGFEGNNEKIFVSG